MTLECSQLSLQILRCAGLVFRQRWIYKLVYVLSGNLYTVVVVIYICLSDHNLRTL